MKRSIILCLLLFCVSTGFAQTIIQNSGWLALINNTKFNDKFGMALDVQVRSSDNWSYVRNVLVRPGITYFLNDRSNITVGYLYQNTHNKSLTGSSDLQEQRIWEQFVYNHKLKSSFITHRGRLEQRFMETATGDIFAQRVRYMVRAMKPLTPYKETFDQGLFLALQDEVFLNIQNKGQLNNSLFDQNRFYIAAGYRFSKKLDIEAGYLNQYLNSIGKNSSNRVAQLAIYTRF